MTKRTAGGAKPRITLTAADHEKLSVLANAAANTVPDMAAELAEELDRAHVLSKGKHAADVVCMGCEVEFRDDMTGRVQKVTLVYPNEADIAKGRISVLTPIGTALIGLPVGQSIDWTTRTGDSKRLTVLQVQEPAVEERQPA
ncbi:nucleoside diphosphate kinase regulator [Microvirga sp. 17 mud 1-3]|uniref:nucleoside diphosphate kinase regulator n=1 Tax=Microvirga sp. 17 mud 1-3 TaxID=2082949 RepID=UPI000D6C0540|nr:nucleoside diphosphate kinase regulator [Microvirga sp. 17 mud 1-3]AWM85426.1 nucleoside diphosphate kinase regulator [Microvirga sp. 17 mud 1-3]